MANSKSNQSLIIAILFAAVVIAGSLIFLAFQLGGGSPEDLQVEIKKGIETYIEEQQAAYEAEQEAATQTDISMEELADDDAFIGEEDAPVTIVEFSDFQCPYCRSFYNAAYQEIKDTYVANGDVKIVFRDFPLSFHPDAFRTALAAECVRARGGDEAYFAFHDMVFEGQSGNGTVEIAMETLVGYARALGLNVTEFSRCVEDEDFKTEIENDLADAQAAGINGTPGFVINGQIVSGAQPFAVFEEVIEAALAEQ